MTDATHHLRALFMATGENIEATGNKPFFLDDPHSCWLVVSGAVEVFGVGRDDNGEPAGVRNHFISLRPGQMILGMDIDAYGVDSGFLVVGKPGTQLLRSRREDLTRSAAALGEQGWAALTGAVEYWVTLLAQKLSEDILPQPTAELLLNESKDFTLPKVEKLTTTETLRWVQARTGELLYLDMEPLLLDADQWFPLAPRTWVAAGDEDVDGSLALTAEIIRYPQFWSSLDQFHDTLCQCEFVNKKLALVDEFQRLKSKAEQAKETRDAANQRIAAVFDKTTVFRRAGKKMSDAAADLTLDAAEQVGRAGAISVEDHPSRGELETIEEQLAAIAKASRFRTRRVALRDDWWNRDQGPIFGRYRDEGHPVALIPRGFTAYDLYDPETKTTRPVTESVAEELDDFGVVFYRPFPEGDMTPMGMLAFGASGIKGDLRTLLSMGVALGILGAFIPYITGQIFDTAIPQSDRALLVQFGVAVLLVALTSTAFKLAQAVAVMRVQGKLDYMIQAAVWDRLLKLPSSFFRDYTAGDLADRAFGISQIREMLAGAGIGAILGAISSVFYLILMFLYSAKLALLAIGITLVFVIASFWTGLARLRYERELTSMGGKIAGLLLQLIGGVAKLRITGTEDHAFKVWADEFAVARRYRIKSEFIQNRFQVFISSFGIFSSMAIFAVLAHSYAEAAKAGATAAPLSTGGFIAFTSAFGAFLIAAQALSTAGLNMLQVVPTFTRLRPILETQPEVTEARAYPGKLTGEIKLSHIHFRYNPDQPWVVDDLSLHIQPGQFVAFVGGSGCGKSTIMRLMLGFEVPERGAVYFGDQDLQNLDLREVRQQMGVVLQDSRLLPTDIYRNIVGTSNKTIDDAWKAAEMAGFDEDIRGMPMGMHTYISEGGGTFSGGQKQRLMIARALVNFPKILFFDEATSALDNRTQAIVTESTEKLQATRVVIAHRLSTVINADVIYVLDKGKIVEQGTYEELMEMNGLFAELAARQVT